MGCLCDGVSTLGAKSLCDGCVGRDTIRLMGLQQGPFPSNSPFSVIFTGAEGILIRKQSLRNFSSPPRSSAVDPTLRTPA
mmetsp:Transcript_0/g.3  ORF Transcript_0/g.3 Transcript_0/m.3 type:complete len:80 (+) Transcript_0:218-457(+)